MYLKIWKESSRETDRCGSDAQKCRKAQLGAEAMHRNVARRSWMQKRCTEMSQGAAGCKSDVKDKGVKNQHERKRQN